MFKISSFNIRCYGLNGEYTGKIVDEKRDEHLIELIHNNLFECDVMIFQEIIDLESFIKILPKNIKCVTYEHSYKKHQHIVICFKNNYELVDIYDSNHSVQNVALNKKTSRPAIYGQLVHKHSKTPIITIIGVHLKSGSTHTKSRTNQIQVISSFIKALDSDVPVVIGGDFNTQSKKFTRLPEDDIVKIDSQLSRVGLARVQNNAHTYCTPWQSHCLDHFWASSNIVSDKPLWVYDIKTRCNHLDMKKTLKDYYKEISDHLPIIAELNITNTLD